MNGGISQADRVLIGAFKHKLPRSHYYRAFRDTIRVDVGEAETLDEAVNNAVAGSFFAHKDSLLIHEVDDGRRKGKLHAYVIRKKAAQYRRNPETGLTERFEPLYPDHLFSIPVDAFEPTRPFDAAKDDPTTGEPMDKPRLLHGADLSERGQ